MRTKVALRALYDPRRSPLSPEEIDLLRHERMTSQIGKGTSLRKVLREVQKYPENLSNTYPGLGSPQFNPPRPTQSGVRAIRGPRNTLYTGSLQPLGGGWDVFGNEYAMESEKKLSRGVAQKMLPEQKALSRKLKSKKGGGHKWVPPLKDVAKMRPEEITNLYRKQAPHLSNLFGLEAPSYDVTGDIGRKIKRTGRAQEMAYLNSQARAAATPAVTKKPTGLIRRILRSLATRRGRMVAAPV